MQQATLPLHAWGFSDGVIEQFLAEGGSTDPSRISKTLGLIWIRDEDPLNAQPPNISTGADKTKRDVLKMVRSTILLYFMHFRDQRKNYRARFVYRQTTIG